MEDFIINKGIFKAEKKYLQYAKDNDLYEAILKILSQDSSTVLSNEVLPCGLTKDQVAIRIQNEADEYVSHRDNMLSMNSEYNDTEIKELIVSMLSDCSNDERIAVLANLHICNDIYFANIDADKSPKAIQKAYEQYIKQYEGLDEQYIIDNMLSTLDISNSAKVLHAYNVILDKTLENKDLDKQVLSDVSQMLASADSIAIRSALVYSYVSRGMLEGVNPAMDPGVVTAYTAAVSDKALVTYLRDKKLVSSSVADNMIKIISAVFAISVSIAVTTLIIGLGVGGFWLVTELGKILIAMGLVEDIAVAIGTLITFLIVYLCGGILKIDLESKVESTEALYQMSVNALRTLKSNHPGDHSDDGDYDDDDDELYDYAWDSTYI